MAGAVAANAVAGALTVRAWASVAAPPALADDLAACNLSRPVSTVVAIDGPSGAGKSTVALCAASESFGLEVLDTAVAMYRAVTLAVLEADVDPSDVDAVPAVAARF